MLELLFTLLGFNPVELAGVPNGFAMLYFVVVAIAASTASAAAFRLANLGDHGRWQIGIAIIAVVALFLTHALHESKFVEFVGDATQIRGEPPTKNFVVPTPFATLDSARVSDYAYGGKYGHTTTGLELRQRALAPESAAATYVTVAVHLALLTTGLAALMASVTFVFLSLRDAYRERLIKR